MADYTSALTGNQMDAALLDVAQHNSEAWAVGTRNGSAVSSGDSTYNNNAKYYAESAYESAARASGSIPSGTAGAVFFDRSQSLTDAQKAQARANIAAAGSNRNLLDNPWWGSGEVVNQRSVSSGTAPSFVYTIDRWKMTYGGTAGTYSLGTSGITFNVPSGSNIQMIQMLPNASLYNGLTLTASVYLANGSIYSGTITRSNGTAQIIFNQPTVIGAVMQTDNSFRLVAYENLASPVRAVKLEKGSYSTLVNDTTPDYDMELMKCEYRCVVYDLPGNFLFCRGVATSATNIAGIIDLPRDMAEDKTPTVSITGSLVTPAGNTITAIAAATYARKNKLRVNLTGTGFTSGTVYDVVTGNSTPKIVISADL